MRLQGKVAVITGAASGMGSAMATLFAAGKAAVVVGDYNLPRLEEAVAKISAAGGAISYCRHGDIAQQESAERRIDTAMSTHGRVNVLVNNAGVMDHFDGVAELSNEMWRRVMGINLDGPMHTMRAAIPHTDSPPSTTIEGRRCKCSDPTPESRQLWSFSWWLRCEM